MSKSIVVVGLIVLAFIIWLTILYKSSENYHEIHPNAAAIKYAIDNEMPPDSAMVLINKGAAGSGK